MICQKKKKILKIIFNKPVKFPIKLNMDINAFNFASNRDYSLSTGGTQCRML